MINKKKLVFFLDNFTSFSFVIPALILFSIFNIYMFADLIRLSFVKSNGLPNCTEIFVGLNNYLYVLKDKIWWESIGRSLLITFFALTFQNLLALVLALIIDQGVRGQTSYRVIFFLPPVLSGVVVGLVWGWIFDGYNGVFNQMLDFLKLDQLSNISWLADKSTALYTVSFIHMWKGFGWAFVIFLAGLQNIDRELYEAANVDGATWWSKFFYITVPLMMPVFILISIITILGSMQIYDIIVATTNGGPGFATEVPVTRILQTMHGSVQEFGVASAQGIIFGMLLLFASLGQVKFANKYKNN